MRRALRSLAGAIGLGLLAVASAASVGERQLLEASPSAPPPAPPAPPPLECVTDNPDDCVGIEDYMCTDWACPSYNPVVRCDYKCAAWVPEYAHCVHSLPPPPGGGLRGNPHLSLAHEGRANFCGCDGCLFSFLSSD